MAKRTAVLAVGVAKRLKQARRSAGLSQRALGERSGISYSTVCLLEQNRGGRAGIDIIDTLARALGVSAGWLAFGEG